MKTELKLICMEDVHAEEVKWITLVLLLLK